MSPWLPKSVLCLRDYSLGKFTSDLVAGITVGLVALPLAMAFAISSGVPPQSGIYCAIITGFIISALGGSATQIGGPTGAFVVVVFGIVQKHGIDGLFMCTMMAGVLLIALGATGLGSAVKFIPRPVVVGFTNGIAVLIASTQIRDFFGLRMTSIPGDFSGRIAALVHAWPTLTPAATVLSIGSLALIFAFSRFVKRVPGTLVALIAGTIVVAVLKVAVETIGTRFGGVPSGLPHFVVPAFRLDLLHTLAQPALTIAMLGAIESLMSATVADRMSGDKHNPNVELVAQGIANVVSPMVGGLPATGAVARTATNIRSGARTPVAGVIHSFTLLTIVLVAAPLVQYIPLAVLASILMVVAYNMGEWREIPELLKLSKADIAVWLATFLLTVFADLTVAVEVGMILAALLFIHRVAVTTTVSKVTKGYVEEGRAHILQDKRIPDYVTIFRIHGPFLFGATDKIEEITGHLESLPPIVILRLRNMTAIDATGLQALEDLADTLHSANRTLILCGAREQPARMMHRAEFEQHVGKENICGNVQEALDRAAAAHTELNMLTR